jgi:hypothetical protein
MKVKFKKRIYLIALVIISMAIPIHCQGQSAPPPQTPQYIPSDQIYNPAMCTENKLIAPLDLKGKMTYKDFNVQMRFKEATNVQTIKLDNTVYLLVGNGFGNIYLDGKKYRVAKAYVKSPSDHQMDGNYVHAEVQVSCIADDGSRLVLVKILQLVDSIEPGYQHGLHQFGFGRGKQLLSMQSKLDMKSEMSLIRAGRVNELPRSAFRPGNKATFETFFIQDEFFYYYQAQETFGNCLPTTWLVSYDPAAINNEEFSDLVMRDVALFNPHEPAKVGKTLYNNKDKPPGYHKKKKPKLAEDKPKEKPKKKKDPFSSKKPKEKKKDPFAASGKPKKPENNNSFGMAPPPPKKKKKESPNYNLGKSNTPPPAEKKPSANGGYNMAPTPQKQNPEKKPAQGFNAPPAKTKAKKQPANGGYGVPAAPPKKKKAKNDDDALMKEADAALKGLPDPKKHRSDGSSGDPTKLLPGPKTYNKDNKFNQKNAKKAKKGKKGKKAGKLAKPINNSNYLPPPIPLPQAAPGTPAPQAGVLSAAGPVHLDNFYKKELTKEQKLKKKIASLPKYKVYTVTKPHKLGWCPAGAILAWKGKELKKVKLTGKKKDFPKSPNKKYQFVPVYYDKSKMKGYFVPNLLAVPSDYDIRKKKKDDPVPVWNQKENRFILVDFDCDKVKLKKKDEEKMKKKIKKNGKQKKEEKKKKGGKKKKDDKKKKKDDKKKKDKKKKDKKKDKKKKKDDKKKKNKKKKDEKKKKDKKKKKDEHHPKKKKEEKKKQEKKKEKKKEETNNGGGDISSYFNAPSDDSNSSSTHNSKHKSQSEPTIPTDQNCDELMNQAANNPTPELTQKLKDLCGISLGSKLQNMVPIFGKVNSIGNAFKSFFSRAAQLPSKPYHQQNRARLMKKAQGLEA